MNPKDKAWEEFIYKRFGLSVGKDQSSLQFTYKAVNDTFSAGWDACLEFKDSSRCEWKHDWESNSYDTSCGEWWHFIEGGAEENGVVYCHKCGKMVTIIPDRSGCKEE